LLKELAAACETRRAIQPRPSVLAWLSRRAILNFTKQQGAGQMPATGANGQMPNGVGAGGGEIIRFPGSFRPRADASEQAADDTAARLDRALLALRQALSDQQKAIWAWREGLDALASGVRALDGGVRALDAALGAAAARLQCASGGDAGHGAAEARERPG